VQAVADDSGPAAFELAGRAVEMGYDLRAVCRELSRVVRDLLVLTVDPARINDPEIAGETERERLKALAARFSREDLLRAFDLLTRAEAEIRSAAQPRYHLEMAMLRWMYLRKLVPIEELIAGTMAGPVEGSGFKVAGSGVSGSGLPRSGAPGSAVPPVKTAAQPAIKTVPPGSSRVGVGASIPSQTPAVPPKPADVASALSRTEGSLKDALLAEIKKSKAVLYNMVIAQAQKIEVAGDRVTFTFSPAQRTLSSTLDQNRPWLESLAQQLAGRKIAIVGVLGNPGPMAAPTPAKSESTAVAAGSNGADTKKSNLREQALADAGVQALLEVFPAEIRDVEEM
jgi:DNA polymerase-3 subunit gamma/tau